MVDAFDNRDVLHLVLTRSPKDVQIINRDTKLEIGILETSKSTGQGKTTRNQPNAVNTRMQQLDELRTINQHYDGIEILAGRAISNDVNSENPQTTLIGIIVSRYSAIVRSERISHHCGYVRHSI